MKKYIVLLATILCCININAQTDIRYDVNYDKPKFLPIHDENTEFFQKIYLQYERSIQYIEAKVRDEEKQNYNIALQEEKQKHKEDLRHVKEEDHKTLLAAISKTRDDIYSLEIQKIRDEEIDRLTHEITEKLTKELTERFTIEYETKKNEEIAVISTKLEKEIYIKTKAGTERIKNISLYAFTSIVIIFIITMTIMVLNKKKIRRIKIESYKNDYFAKLKTFRGDTSAFTEEISKEKSMYEKNIKNKALKLAIDQYNLEKDIEPLEQVIKYFESIKNKNIFSKWNGSEEDIQFRKGLCNEFRDNINAFFAKGSEIWASIQKRTANEKDDIIKLFDSYANYLDSNAKRIKELALESKNHKDLCSTLKNISKEYKNLAKKFKKRKF